MAKSIVIVESPAKAKTIEKFLGKDFRVLASYGHIRDLPRKGLGVDREHAYEPTYEILAGKEKTINELKKAVKTADNVYLAADPIARERRSRGTSRRRSSRVRRRRCSAACGSTRSPRRPSWPRWPMPGRSTAG